MSREVRTVTPQTTLGEAALLMRQADIGALLVNEGERLTGVVTRHRLAGQHRDLQHRQAQRQPLARRGPRALSRT
ncbi:CBS domain-containing protein [Pseudomonas aeruginosa]|uniref:CBS domain-containing protein n=1 Tax=Pseudomonas aeruginosa TaxID=287 RepID=UPI001FF769CE|nr:CBS domain-containing protein [Pseudomonas aeruginosa]